MNLLKLGLVLGGAFLLQFVLTSFQMKNFNNAFIRLRRQGRVVIGRKAGGFFAGAIVMFLIDSNGVIQKGQKLEGTTFLTRVKDFPGFEGIYVQDLRGEMVPKSHRNLRRALEDAAGAYRKFVAGETIPDAPSPFQKVGKTFSRTLFKRHSC